MAMYNANLVSGAEIILNGEVVDATKLELTADVKIGDFELCADMELPANGMYARYTPAVLKNELHILGIKDASTYDSHYKWNGTTWVKVGITPFECPYSSAVINDELHLLGGWNKTKYHYKWNGTTWTSVGTLPCDVSYPYKVTTSGNNIYICGDGGIYVYDGITWTQIVTTSITISSSGIVVCSNEIHLIGCDSDRKGHYKVSGTSLTNVSTMPINAQQPMLISVCNKIHLLGSTSSNYYYYHYTWDGITWTQLNNMPMQGGGTMRAVWFDNYIHVFGTGTDYNDYTASEYKHCYRALGEGYENFKIMSIEM